MVSWFRLGVSFVFMVTVPACSAVPMDGSDSAEHKGTTQGGVATFQGIDIDGEAFDLSDHLGKDVVLISFWATWCEPCKAEMPFVQQVHEKYGDKGLHVVSISIDGPETQSGVRPFLRSSGYTFQVIIDEDSSISQAINPRTAAPFTVIIDRHGNVAKTIEGFQLSEGPMLDAEIRELLEAGH